MKTDDLTAINFVTWTDINLASSIDFLQSILAKHGDLSGEYASLSEIIEALKQGQRYTTEYRAHVNKETLYTLGRCNNMTFIDCIPYLLDGKSIRQSWWFEGMILLFTQDGDESLVMLEPTTINGQEVIICRPYEMSKDDLITDSWMVI